ncbi:hypothetical protein NE235_12320 [Actinoallomurus spadix]|uniref:Aminoglycoside phosphotransferase domain-containing protein n=1 Tax=Actinoallomurus spadix TaxID=79912 RepID=A0ABN0X6K0_9ACTN|nr:hypothetical protein [Actinoallomurus spadix]MCO5986887.1 hypothetical protein [Actinoallomurus spadix]
MLRALVERLWLPEPESSGWPVRVTSGEVPPGYQVVERYAVVPSPDRPRFLVPLDGRAVAAGSLTHYNGLRWARLRVPRTVLGAGFRTGIAPLVLRHRLLVCVPEKLPDAELSDYLLSAHLGRVLGLPRPALGVGVRAPDPNSKPTLQLFGADGAPVGYAKVGWNPATREMTRREADAIAAVSATPAAGIRVPELLHHGPWRDYDLTVTAPLPPKIRRYREAEPPRVPHDAGSPDQPTPTGLLFSPDQPTPTDLPGPPNLPGPFAVRTTKLADTAFWRALRAEAAVLAADDDERRLAALVTAHLDELEREHGDTPLRVGRWHGDWVPWNMGRYAGDLYVWDWEHSAEEVPAGFDHLHWRFQDALVLRGRPLAEAVAAVRAAAGTELPELPSDHRRLLGRLYLLEMFMRTYHLKRLGGGWNPALHPAMLEVLEER